MIPDPSNPQAWNRYSYVGNNPVNFNDPTGHKACDEEKGCGGTMSKVKKNSGSGGGGRDDEERHHGIHDIIELPTTDENSFLSDNAYMLDKVGAGASYINMVVADTIMAIIAGVGCATGAACLPAIGDALLMDFLITTFSPVGAIENGSAVGSATLTILDDIFNSKTTYYHVDDTGANIGVGRDTVISVGNMLAGFTPEANFDAWVSNNQLSWDNARRSGKIPASTQFNFRIPDIWGKGRSR